MVTPKNNTLLVWIYAIILIISVPPFYFWNMVPVLIFIKVLALLLFGLWELPKTGLRRWAVFLLFVFYFYVSRHPYLSFNSIGVLWRLCRITLLCTIFCIGSKNIFNIYKKFVIIYAIIMIPSLIEYFLVCWFHIPLSYSIILPLNEIKKYTYRAYNFMVVVGMWDYYRFCGYFDEPGVIGTISGVLLALNRFNMKDWKSWPILISGIVSFSLFFYVFIALYLLLFGKTRTKIIVGFSVFVVLMLTATSDTMFNELILERLKIDSGKWIGDNRTKSVFDDFYVGFIHSDKFWFGYGDQFCSLVADSGGASYKHIIVDYGIIMSSVFFLAFFLYYTSYRLKVKNLLFSIMIFLTVLFQRPMVLSIVYLFLLVSPPAVFKHNEDDRSDGYPLLS